MKFHSNRFLTRPAVPPFTNHSFSFKKWLGRDLVPFERRIIETLERIRHRLCYSERHARSSHPVHVAAIRRLSAKPARPMRVFVDDFGLHGDAIRNLLIGYVSWLQQCIEPDLSTVIVHRTKKLAREAVRDTPLHRSPQTILCSCKRAHSVRGITFHRALLLDTGCYGRATIRKQPHHNAMTGCGSYRPERTQAFRIIAGAVIAPLQAWHSSLLLIHGDPRQHPGHHYARLRAAALSDPDASPYTVISPDTHVQTGTEPQSVQPANLQPYGMGETRLASGNALSSDPCDFPEPLIVIPA